MRLQARCEVKEREDIKVSNFVRDLNLAVRKMMALQTIETLEEAMNKARKVERM